MISPPPNRLAELFTDPPKIPAPRTEAQRQASRLNGSRICGPRTAAGKRKCRFNALTHGLLARAIAPPADIPRGREARGWPLAAG
ncbi:MAG: hypothetical protein ACHRHE_12730 [Tepidisphaerales bacterium]